MQLLSDLLFQGEDLLQASAAAATKGVSAQDGTGITLRQQQEGRAFASAFDTASRTEISTDPLTTAPAGLPAAPADSPKTLTAEPSTVTGKISPAGDHGVGSTDHGRNDADLIDQGLNERGLNEPGLNAQGLAVADLSPASKPSVSVANGFTGTMTTDAAGMMATGAPAGTANGATVETTAADLAGVRKNDRADATAPVASIDAGPAGTRAMPDGLTRPGLSAGRADPVAAATAQTDSVTINPGPAAVTIAAPAAPGGVKSVLSAPVETGSGTPGQAASPATAAARLPSAPFDVSIVTHMTGSENSGQPVSTAAQVPAGAGNQPALSVPVAHALPASGPAGSAVPEPVDVRSAHAAAAHAAPATQATPDAAVPAAAASLTGPVAPKADNPATVVEAADVATKALQQSAPGQTEAQGALLTAGNSATASTPSPASGMARMIADPAIQSQALQQVASAIEASHKGSGRMELRLDPPELGRVSIDFRFDGDSRVTAILHADQPETATLIRRSLDILMRDLASAGFTDINLSMGSAGREAGQQQAGQHQAERSAHTGGHYAATRDSETQAQKAPQAFRPGWSADTIDIRL